MANDPSSLSKAEIAAIAARIDRPIVLVGMMGVGKSSIGRKLANLLDLPFTDADDAIEEAAKMPITEMFERFGEASFRDGERRVIQRLMEQKHAIIATGGGAFCDPQTRELIRDKGLAIWLDCEIETLLDRVGRKNNRPLLRDGDPREILTRLRDERAPFYAEAPIHVISESGPHQHTLLTVLQAIDQWL